MILTISGLHGTGKSAIGKMISQKLGIRYYSTGQAFRDLAKEKNFTLEEFTDFVEKNPDVDKKLDDKIIEIAIKGNVIIDSQLSAYILESIADFKILLNFKERLKSLLQVSDQSQIQQDYCLVENLKSRDPQLC